MAMARLKKGFIRLGDISLVAIAISCGYAGYQFNANEEAAKQKRIRSSQALAQRRRVEDQFFQIARQYDLKVDELMEKRDQVYKLREDTHTLYEKVSRRIKEVSLEIEKLQKLLNDKEELDQLASSVHQQKRRLDAEVKELSTIVKIKEDLQARSKLTLSAPTTADMHELEILSSKIQERNRVLEAEIDELMRLVKVKEELVAKSEALDKPVITHPGDPMLEKDGPVQS